MKNVIAYKKAYLISLIAFPITLILYYLIWTSIYSVTNTQNIAGFDAIDMVVYLAISVIVSHFTQGYYEKTFAIIDGSIAYYFIKPVNYDLLILIGGLTRRIFAIIPKLFVIGIIIVLLEYYSVLRLENFVLGITSLAIGTALAYLIYQSLNNITYFIYSVNHIHFIFENIGSILKGAMIPLVFFPESISKFLIYIPYAYFLNNPIMFFTGRYGIVEFWNLTVVGIAWILVFYLLQKISNEKGIKRYENQGG